MNMAKNIDLLPALWFDDKPFTPFHQTDGENAWLILITKGKAVVSLNGVSVSVSAPCMLVLTKRDEIKLENSACLEGYRMGFALSFINKSLTFRLLENDIYSGINDNHDKALMQMFITRDDRYRGIIGLTAQEYLCIKEWLAVTYQEGIEPTDNYSPCRIRRYLLQALFLLDEIFRKRRGSNYADHEKPPVDIALEYMHMNYSNEITLASLCDLAHINRTSLSRKFKEATGSTPMEYLLNYRLKLACEMLTCTACKLGDISESLGFNYESYFIRQFTAKIGVSPTEYRKMNKREY
jgi:AraC-like DNA-binding protein